MTDEWMTMSKDAKATFVKEAHSLAGHELKAAISTTISQWTSHNRQQMFQVSSTWMDSFDLEKEFGSKPEQLAAIKQNSSSFMCPIRNTLVFEVPRYTSSSTETKEQTRRQEYELNTDGSSAATKVVKPDKGEKRKLKDDTEAVANKPLSAGGLKRIEKMLVAIETMETRHTNLMPHMNNVPAPITNKVNLLRAELDAFHAELTVAATEKATYLGDHM